MGTSNEALRVYEVLAPVSIQLMSPASGNNRKLEAKEDFLAGFHSINVPSEWERSIELLWKHNKNVSIQLMSPASGNGQK